jgi:hypothetical protein
VRRVALLTLDSAVSTPAVCEFLQRNRSRIGLVVMSDLFAQPGGGSIRRFLRQVVRSGPRFGSYIAHVYFFQPHFTRIAEWLVPGWSRRNGIGSIARTCRRLGVECVRCADVNDGRIEALLADHRIELVICCYFDQILRRPLLDGAGRTFINVHPGPLPEYRGLFPEFHAAAGGDDRFGYTIHRIDDERIDAGPQYCKALISVAPGASMLHISRQVLHEAVNALDGLLAQSVLPAPSPPASGPARYHSYPTRAEMRRLPRPLFLSTELSTGVGDK